MILELERAERVRDVLDRVRRRVREVVHRIDAPGVAGPVVMRAPDPVQHRVAQVDVRRRHVDLRAQDVRAVGELPGPHAREQIEVLLDRSVAIRALAAGLGQRPAVLADLVRRLAVDVRLAALDQMHARTRTAARNSRRRSTADRPSRSRASARPSLIDSTYSTSSFSGFVSSKRRLHVPPNSSRDAEVQADRLRVADVEVAVRLRRKARGDAAAVLPGGHVSRPRSPV